jgi:hypothetical protein
MLVLFGEIQHLGPLPRAYEQMNPHKIVQDPPRRWVLHRLTLLVGERRVMLLEGLPDAVLQRRIDS